MKRVDLDGRLRRHERCRAAVVHVGHERSPVLVIDDFLSDPAALVDFAASASEFASTPDDFYPGIRAPTPPIYCFALRAFLGEAVSAAFGLDGSTIDRELSYLSLITRAPASLHPLQRIPHTDGFESRKLAVLHYLCGAEHGGTSFYRHRRTGFETIPESRRAEYQRVVIAEFGPGTTLPEGYIQGDAPGFEQIASFDAAPNRVLVYRSINLHSANIGRGFKFLADPRAGRLTVNTFWVYRS